VYFIVQERFTDTVESMVRESNNFERRLGEVGEDFGYEFFWK
jgi:hypothetical protein